MRRQPTDFAYRLSRYVSHVLPARHGASRGRYGQLPGPLHPVVAVRDTLSGLPPERDPGPHHPRPRGGVPRLVVNLAPRVRCHPESAARPQNDAARLRLRTLHWYLGRRIVEPCSAWFQEGCSPCRFLTKWSPDCAAPCPSSR